MESGEISTQPASLDPPDPYNYTIGDYFKFAYLKTIKRKTFTKIFYRYLKFYREDFLSGIYRQKNHLKLLPGRYFF